VELARDFATLAGRRLFARCRAELGLVLEAGATERLIFWDIARQLASSASPRAFRRRAVARGEGETGGADVTENVDVALDPTVAAPVRAAARRAKVSALGAVRAHAGDNIDVTPEATPRAPGRALAGRGEAGPDLVTCCAQLVREVGIPLDPAPHAVHGPATRRAKRRHLAASALFALHIHIPRHAAPSAPKRALGARGGKVGARFAARGAHFADQVDFPFDPAPRAVHGLATRLAERRLYTAPALLVLHIHIPGHAAQAAPECALGARGGEDGVFFTASRAHFVTRVDIPLDPAPRAMHLLSTWRAKRRHLAAPALLGHNIHIPSHAAPAAPDRALGARGGKNGMFFSACGAHLANQVDIPVDPAPCAVHSLATGRAERRLFAASALLVLHIHIPSHAAPAAPERFLSASAGKRGAFFAAVGALGHACQLFFPFFFFFIYFFFSQDFNLPPAPLVMVNWSTTELSSLAYVVNARLRAASATKTEYPNLIDCAAKYS
jgi:hypothetical protein